MKWRNTIHRYGSLSMGLHWLMLVLLAAVYASIELRGYFPKGSALRDGLKAWHFTLGLCVLLLAMARVVVSLVGPSPLIQPPPPRWQHLLSKAMQLGLYALMLGMPLLGWLARDAKGEAIFFFGLQLPTLIEPNASVADWVKELHETGGDAGYVLIALHAAAALFHHHVVRDDTLRRMLPGRR